MKRGDLVTVAMQGDFGKPRPALVIQSDIFNDTHATVTVLLVSSEMVRAPVFRVSTNPTPDNGLKVACQIQVDKIMSVRREKIGDTFGHLDADTMIQINRALAVWTGIA